jgi:CheY-like chemotaxis protein
MSRKGRILVLDDEEKWRQAFVSILKQADFYVDAAASTDEAEKLLKESFYHLAIIDVSMLPGDGSDEGGIILLGALDEANLLGTMEVIVVSAYGTMERMRRAFKQYKVADFQPKDDFDPPVFVSLVERMFKDEDKDKDKVRINLNLDIHWQQAKDADQIVTKLKMNGVSLKSNMELRERMTAELDDLLCRLFYTARSLLVNPLSPGQSGSAVLLATPFYGSGAGKPVVVKFGHLQKIDVEYKNFKEYAQPFIGGGRSTSIIELRRTPRLGGIVYSLLGTASDHLESFNTFYAHADIAQIKKVLDGLVHETCGLWYANPGNLQLIDLTGEYQQRLECTKENLESALAQGLKSVQGKQKLYFESLSGAFTNPILFALEQDFSKPTYRCVTHGDLNGSNVLIDAKGQAWLIDFELTGPGHILRDLAELDTVVRFHLLGAEEATLDERLQMEQALGRAKRFTQVEQLASDFKTENQALLKAYETTVHLRTLAYKLVAQNPSDDLDEYYIALLYYSLNTIRFYSLPSLQRQHALLSASLLADHLHR